MAGLFKKIIKGVLIGAGTVVGLFAPKVGANIIVAGKNIETGTPTSSADVVSVASANLKDTLTQAKVQSAVSATTTTFSSVMEWLKQYWYFLAGGIALLFLWPKLFKKRRR